MKKSSVIAISLICLIGLISLIVYFKKSSSGKPPVVIQEEKVELPINTIPVSERPFITLTPDKSGHNLDMSVIGAPQEGQMEYEILYNTGDSQEGGLGALNLAGTQPITKSILLGTRSAGGATTYHEGVTGGSLTVTYGLPAGAGEVKLKEQFNFLRFDPTDPTVTSSDLHFSVTLPKTALKKDMVVVVMKPFGLPAVLTGKLVAGPYLYTTPEAVKGSVEVTLKLPAGEYTNAAIYTFGGGKWTALKTSKKGEDTLTATASSGNVFLVAEE